MKKKKWRDIRNAVTMMCVMVAMLSTATYAWFTLTDSPTVAGLQMQAVSSGGLLVSKEADSGFANAIEITDTDTANLNGDSNPLILTPVTPSSQANGAFCMPKYEGGYVTGLLAPITGEELEGHVAVYTYYIKAEVEDNETVNVGIITGDAGQTNSPVLEGQVPKATGTFIREKKTNAGDADDSTHAEAAIRVGLLVNGTTWIVYEPNNDVTFTGTTAPVASTAGISAVTADVISKADGTITEGYLSTTDTTTSETLFTVGNSATTVKMYVWLEGTDDECANEVQADMLEGQIQFTIVE